VLRFFNDVEAAGALQYVTVMAAIERAFESLAHGRAAIKPRSRSDCGAVKLSSMGAIWPDAGLAGEKVYTTVEGRFGFLFNLFDLRDGAPLAVMQAGELTRVRTAALTALAASRGAVATAKLAVFGAGVQGRAHIEALVAALPFVRIDVVDVADVSAWCADASRHLGVSIRQCSAHEALHNADVVVTITRSKKPLFDGALLKPGTFVAAVGTSLPNGRELDDVSLSRAARIVVEWKPQSCVEAGEIVLGKLAGSVDDLRVVDLTEIFAGKERWRTRADEIVIFKSVGVGLTDLAAASVVWQNLGAAAT
jgi:ornithine cyclodeaminase